MEKTFKIKKECCAPAGGAGFCVGAGTAVLPTARAGWSTDGVYLLTVFASTGLVQQPALAVALGSAAGIFFNDAVSRWQVFQH